MTAVAWPAQLDLATGLAQLAEQVQEWPGLGRRAPGPLRLIVVPDAAGLQAVTRGRAPAWGAAVADPGQRTIVLRADAGDPAAVLRHELAHLVLRGVVSTRLPLWFDEGYATWAANGWDALDAARLHLAVLRGGAPGLDALDAQLRGSESEAGTAYLLAASAVLEVARRVPGGRLDPLLARLARGEAFPEALEAATGLAPDRFDEAWRQALRSRYGGLLWAVGFLGWLVVAVAVVVAARTRRGRDAPRRAALDAGWDVSEDEPELPPPPADPLDPTGRLR